MRNQIHEMLMKHLLEGLAGRVKSYYDNNYKYLKDLTFDLNAGFYNEVSHLS